METMKVINVASGKEYVYSRLSEIIGKDITNEIKESNAWTEFGAVLYTECANAISESDSFESLFINVMHAITWQFDRMPEIITDCYKKYVAGIVESEKIQNAHETKSSERKESKPMLTELFNTYRKDIIFEKETKKARLISAFKAQGIYCNGTHIYHHEFGMIPLLVINGNDKIGKGV